MVTLTVPTHADRANRATMIPHARHLLRVMDAAYLTLSDFDQRCIDVYWWYQATEQQRRQAINAQYGGAR